MRTANDVTELTIDELNLVTGGVDFVAGNTGSVGFLSSAVDGQTQPVGMQSNLANMMHEMLKTVANNLRA
jgi:bacteriocin-like protein